MNQRKLIVGNWKMNGLKSDAVALAYGIAERMGGRKLACDLMVCPPFVHIDAVVAAAAGSELAVGGQNCDAAASGAHTGDVSAGMLRDLGCTAVIIGHSERRSHHGESNSEVHAKALAAHQAGLLAIIAIGETAAQRDAGRTLNVVAAQLERSLPDAATAADTVIAYEPIWAIGTGRTPTAAQVVEVLAAIRATATAYMGPNNGASLRILYGGSVTPANAAELLSLADVGGALVGGASLKLDQFWSIVQSCP